jgi:hypothetical protein
MAGLQWQALVIRVILLSLARVGQRGDVIEQFPRIAHLH